MSTDSQAPPEAAGDHERECVDLPRVAPSADSHRGLPRWLSGVGLILLVLAAYWPVFRGGFVWDDTVLIDRNSLIKGEANLLSIWFREDFPMSIAAFWLQWLAWGKQAAGYHVVNVWLHAGSVLLLWRVLSRLTIRGDWFGAALFAVHPVAVASVAWISELKNTLSLVFFLLSLNCYFEFDSELRTSHSALRTTKWYWLALGSFLLALLSKTSTVMLPVVVLAVVWWQRRRVDRGDALRVGPFFLLAMGFGLLTIWFQTHHVITGQPVQAEGYWVRLAGAGWALWFYLGKALLPLNLVMIYPRWEINTAQLSSWLPLVLWVGLLATCWCLRTGWGRHALFALGCFSALLFPVLGFFDMYFLSMSRVSDHFAYLALVPVAALAGAVLGGAQRGKPDGEPSTLNIQRPTLKVLAAVVIIALMSGLTMRRARVFATDEGLWRDTLAKNPNAWVAHNNLGCILAERNKIVEAEEHFTASLQTNPRNAEAHRNLGKALVLQEQFTKAEEHLRTAIQLNPKDAEAQRTLASALTGLGKPDAAATALRAALRIKSDAETRLELASLMRGLGDFREAVAQLRLVVAAKPESAEAQSNLAWLLATSADAALRNGAEAVQMAERACRLTGETNAMMVATRAAAYAEAERFDEAVASAEKAIALAAASGNTSFARINQQLLRLYRTRLPYHEPTPRQLPPGR